MSGQLLFLVTVDQQDGFESSNTIFRFLMTNNEPFLSARKKESKKEREKERLLYELIGILLCIKLI